MHFCELGDHYPLTPIQHGMLLHQLASPGSGFDIEQMVAKLEGPVDVNALRRACEALVARHDVFRTSFAWEGLVKPVQMVHERVNLSWTEDDWSRSTESDRELRFAEFVDEDRRRGFDPAAAPLTRFALFRLSEEDWRFVWTFHHMLADGGCYPSLIREMFARYEAIKAGVELNLPDPPKFRDFVAWSDARRVEMRAAAEIHWKDLLKGFAAATPLPGSDANGSGGYAEQSLSTAVTAPAGVTMSTLVDAAWALVLARHTGEEDVVFGETRACRKDTVPDAASIAGLFINTVPVRVRCSSGMAVRGWLAAVQKQRRDVRPFEHTPLTDIQAWSEIAPGSRLFHNIVVFTPHLIGALLREPGGEWLQRDIRFLERTNFPLTLFAYNESELLLKLAYDRSRVSDATAARLLAALQATLQSLTASPECNLGAVDTLPASERHKLAVEWNRTACAFESSRCIHEVFEQQAQETPHAIAVVFRDESLTYSELNARANQLADALRKLGAGPDKLIGVCLERSLQMMVGLLAVLKSGSAYVPLDPAYPKERLGWMLEDTRAAIVLTQSSLLASLPIHPAEIVCIDQEGWRDENIEAANVVGCANPNNLAYVLFTSGSSGRPKGVMIEHRSVMNFFTGMDRVLGGRRNGTWLAVTSISFDISVLELFWTLCRGFKVVLHKQDYQAGVPKKRVDFSLFYFAAHAAGSNDNKYRLLLEGAKFADTHGFSAIWTPERHFHEFGGLYPNPALTSAAVAAVTSRVQIRAGSVVLPLHNPIRVAEDWSVVDNLSGGRVGLSFASGWHANDFAIMPENWANRRELVFQHIETVRKLWRGESITCRNGAGEPTEVRIFPAPMQRNPEVWITAATNIDTFRLAGEIGANLLTNLLGQTTADLEQKIEGYRSAFRENRAKHGRSGEGHVTLMLHTFAGESTDEVRQQVRDPFLQYLKTSTDLIKRARWEFPAFGRKNRIKAAESAELTEDESNALMEHAFERYFKTSGLFGSVTDCVAKTEQLRRAGVDEVACLIDFGVDDNAVLRSLEYLNKVREISNRDAGDYSLASELRRHQVTHLQCTPSMARMMMAEEESRAALKPLEKVLLGGEALPPALAEQVTQVCDGELINMYGPTETTVWSTSARVEKRGEVTLGRPIANTEIYIVDRSMQLAPVGTPGEILIGGAGVARGYLNRPELTAEKFILNPFGAGRLYRTGDLGRYQEDGRIEFLRRMDSQVKIRGHRIEMGDIEAAIDRSPRVWESAVTARTDASGDAQLIAYVAPRPSCSREPQEASNEAVARWTSLWDEVYRAPSVDSSCNFNGWNSSYTSERIPEADMREWVEATVQRVRSLRPRRVLEIGCGTGLLLLRLAPDCESYTGADASPEVVASVRREIERRGLGNVEVRQAAAHELGGLNSEQFDVVIINSVIQYFPDETYLRAVLERVAEAVVPGGAIFVGDVRHYGLMEAFHTSVELSRASSSLPLEDLRSRIQQRSRSESELLVAPEFFRALQQANPRIGEVRMELKRGRYWNEMTAFRYDVTITIGDRAEPVEPLAAGTTIEEIAAHLQSNPISARFTGIPNDRLAKTVRAANLLASAGCPATAGEVKQAAEGANGVEPEALRNLRPDYEVEVLWSDDGLDRMDAVFRKRGAPRLLQPIERRLHPESWREYVNARQPALASGALIEELKQHLKKNLPAYMVPAAYVVLPALPRTPNGKIDWKALPVPEQTQREVSPVALPVTVTERKIAEVWKELLNLDTVGLHDNFFDLGANSLTMVQASSRLKNVLDEPVSLLDLFRYPSTSLLAAHLSEGKSAEPELQHSEARGRARLDAALRRMHARQVASEELGA